MSTLAELQVLYRALSRLLVKTAYGTASHRNCLASLENTIREINVRYAYQWKLGAGLLMACAFSSGNLPQK